MTRMRPSGRLLRVLVALLPAAAIMLSLSPPAHAAPAVAFVSSKFIYLEDYDVVEDFREAGFEVGALAWKTVTAESLQSFNAIVLTDIPGANERGELPQAIVPAVQAIHDYAQDGGEVHRRGTRRGFRALAELDVLGCAPQAHQRHHVRQRCRRNPQ